MVKLQIISDKRLKIPAKTLGLLKTIIQLLISVKCLHLNFFMWFWKMGAFTSSSPGVENGSRPHFQLSHREYREKSRTVILSHTVRHNFGAWFTFALARTVPRS